MYKLTPQKKQNLEINNNLSLDNSSVNYLNHKFENDNWIFTNSGSHGLALALEYYCLDKNDLVTILTTSENFYISQCVTNQIEKFCKWNRIIKKETKVIIVNHEFGYPYNNMSYLVSLGIPIIEDCCTTFFTQDKNNKLGKYGDFSVYSFPKFFPINLGGILTLNKNQLFNQKSILSDNKVQHITNVISNAIKNENELLNNRSENFSYGLKLFLKLGFTERFKKDKNTIPYAMLLNNHNIIKDLNNFKLFMYSNGVENSIFYGEDAFFIPNHQGLSFADIDSIFKTVSVYLNKYNS